MTNLGNVCHLGFDRKWILTIPRSVGTQLTKFQQNRTMHRWLNKRCKHIFLGAGGKLVAVCFQRWVGRTRLNLREKHRSIIGALNASLKFQIIALCWNQNTLNAKLKLRFATSSLSCKKYGKVGRNIWVDFIGKSSALSTHVSIRFPTCCFVSKPERINNDWGQKLGSKFRTFWPLYNRARVGKCMSQFCELSHSIKPLIYFWRPSAGC